MTQLSIQVREVEKRFGAIRALGPVSFEIPQGAQFALLGESGSGKSTLLNLLSCMDSPSQGSVLIAGQDTRDLNDSDLSSMRLRSVGYVHQFFDLIGDLSAIENVQLPLWMAGESSSETRAKELLEEVGLGHRLIQATSVLSGGEQQRVAIARALALSPPVILADEPSGSLDSKTGEQVMDLLISSARRLGSTLVVATHSAAASARFTNFLKLKDGILVESKGLAEMPGEAPA